MLEEAHLGCPPDLKPLLPCECTTPPCARSIRYTWAPLCGQRKIPFHKHQPPSDASVFNLMYCASLRLPLNRENNLCRKDLPGLTTLAAWLNSPSNDSSYRISEMTTLPIPHGSGPTSLLAVTTSSALCLSVSPGMSTLYEAPHISPLLGGYPTFLRPP